jgi:hypothetical protein
MCWYLQYAHKLSVADIEEDESLGVGGGEKGGVGVDADRFVTGQAVLVQVQVYLVHPPPTIAVAIQNTN